MSYSILRSSEFKRDYKLLKKRGYSLEKLHHVLVLLASGETLELRYRDHKLIGNWKGYRECHIAPDWLLIYKVEKNQISLARTGSHADLFKK
jgi:mRNA interferase YafQ